MTQETCRCRLESHVRVPLRNKLVEGVVVAVQQERESQDYDYKKIKAILGTTPVLTDAQIRTAQWMSGYYRCSLRQALSVFLSSPPWDHFLPVQTVHYSLVDASVSVRGAKQQSVVDALAGVTGKKKEDLLAETGASMQTIKTLLERNIIRETVVTESGDAPVPDIHQPTLTGEQARAHKEIVSSSKPALLFGVTGSGKTEVYARLIADAVSDEKQAILLVPEILLTEHCIDRFQALLGSDAIAVLHSRLTPAQKRAEWRRIHQGHVSLVIGSRSALFAPLKKLSLIILDEEHEWTYKNEQTPRYHARETAEQLCRYSGSRLVLGSATPSIESWSRAKGNRYTLARLPNRYQNNKLPDVRIIDLASVAFGKHYPFSPPLLEAIEERLSKGEQSVLFLNRRGVATALLCFDCRRRVVSPDSQLPFSVHRRGSGAYFLYDHTTGLRCEPPMHCPSCGSANLKAIGAGTQGLESVLSTRFPSARVIRADSDTLTHPEKMRLVLEKMRNGRADILLGTQSVVKGLDLPNVTLAAVLIADIGLSLPHFRAGERSFQLLSQLTGRSGRAKPGQVIIQTFRPDAPEVRYTADHRTEEYLDAELKLRMHAQYPPALPMARLLARSPQAASDAKTLVNRIRVLHPDAIVGCSPSLFGGGSVWQILVRDPKLHDLLPHIADADVTVDVDPIECI